MNPTETAKRCAEELNKKLSLGECTYVIIIPIIKGHIDAYTAELKSKNNKLINVCSLAHNALDNLMGDSDLDNDDSLEMRACQALAEVLNSDRPESMVAKSIQGLTSIAELQAEIDRLKKALESESKGTLIVEVHRLKKALAKAQAERNELREHAALTDKEILQLSDWLISNAEFDPKTGLIDHCQKLKERVRDLIALEGEVGDLKEQLTLSQERERELVKLVEAIISDLKAGVSIWVVIDKAKAALKGEG